MMMVVVVVVLCFSGGVRGKVGSRNEKEMLAMVGWRCTWAWAWAWTEPRLGAAAAPSAAKVGLE